MESSKERMRLYGDASSSSKTAQSLTSPETLYDNGHQHHHHLHHPAPHQSEAFYNVYHYQQHYVPAMTVYNEGHLPPPPGLSPPCGAPPGFYYPPQQQQQQAPHPLYYGQSPYSPPVIPMHQQPYGHFQYVAATPGANAAASPPSLSPVRAKDMFDRGDGAEVNPSPAVNGAKKPVIDPMIENIVGSMSMSTNGTYTPFGPSVSIASSVVGGGHLAFSSEMQLEGSEAKTSSAPPLLSSVVAGSIGKDKIGIVKPRVIGRETVTEKVAQRAATPKDGTDSRPQTPGKLSYSEVLARSEAKGSNVSSSASKVSSAPTSNSPSPGPGIRIADQVCSSTTPGGVRRTSVTSSDCSKDASNFNSNSSSSSSSPVTKPKLPSNSNNSFEMVIGRGSRNKENSSNSSSKSSTKNTPAGTPTHVNNMGTPTGQKGSSSSSSSKKVLNVSNSQQQSGGKNKTGVPNPPAAKAVKNFPFEFDIEDVDELQEKLVNGEVRSSSVKRDSLGGNASSSSTTKNTASSTGEKKPSVVQNGKGGGRGREKSERQQRNKKGRDGCIVRRIQLITTVWALHLISALNWLYRLVLDVGTLSCSLALSLLEDGLDWWKANAFPSCCQQLRGYMTKLWNLWTRLKTWKLSYLWRRRGGSGESGDGSQDAKYTRGGGGGKGGLADILSMMGPERNILLPANGEEALKRLMSVKGQDPYSILGIRSDSTDETIRRYYKKQAVLVHPDKNMVPGAEEAFKILARAFELIGEPAKRIEYHRQLLEAHQKEMVFGEIGLLLEQLRKKIESVSNSIRCTKCNSRHKKNRTDRPLFAARYCAQCRINHAAREGDLWAERCGLFGWSRSYFACMESSIWEVNEWASCQKKNLKHLLPDCHNVMYRLVAGGGGAGGGSTSSSVPPSGGTANNAFGNGNCCSNGHPGHKAGKFSPTCNHGNGSTNGWDDFGGPSREGSVDADMDDWDSLINNFVRNPNSTGSASSHYHHPHKNTHVNSSSASSGFSGSFTGSKFNGLGSAGVGVSPSAAAGATGCPTTGPSSTNPSRRRGKAKRK